MSPLTAAWVCWAIVGFSPIAGKLAAGIISPILLVFYGTLIGILYFAPWATKNKKWGELFAAQTWLQFLFIGTFGTALPFTVFLIALHYTTPGNAAILQQSELFYSLLIAAVFLREIPSKSQLAGSTLIVAGVLIILLKKSPGYLTRGVVKKLCTYLTIHLITVYFQADIATGKLMHQVT
ncbi:MAG: DMT family transporter [Elusimicrobiaceae bacterium]|nr:DMT family transporter [Elusimicrobiaceae bacterium]